MKFANTAFIKGSEGMDRIEIRDETTGELKGLLIGGVLYKNVDGKLVAVDIPAEKDK